MPNHYPRTLIGILYLAAVFFAGWTSRSPFIARMRAKADHAVESARASERLAWQQSKAATASAEHAIKKVERNYPAMSNILGVLAESEPPQLLLGSLSFISWKAELNATNWDAITRQLQALPKCDAYLLQEVHSSVAPKFANLVQTTMGKQYRHVISSAPRSTRLMIIYNSSRLRLQCHSELQNYRDHSFENGKPLVAHFTDNNGFQFQLVTLHESLGGVDKLRKQAIGLSAWANSQPHTVFAVGDFNIDVDSPEDNSAFHTYVADNVFTCAEPKTHTDNKSPSLCFGFHTQLSKGIHVTTRVIVTDEDSLNDDESAANRPVEIVVAGRR